ncbi:GGDEF domain-containing protein [Sphingomonas radiodurans]|uniref:GGDEF domain-containing protein n=1 Tax=Sphingomonas radiodurans TaxID=2890321 RepID=UPI001E490911|nr:diguanylate cyclase [Sphingomonas radiodurans]WBH15813.1 diguanylate cyclase [Sphingomonas radiodurans]
MRRLTSKAQGKMRSEPESDHLLRWIGGEEFGLVLGVPDPAAAAIIADRLRTAFAAAPVVWDDQPIRATVSIGACYLDCDRGAAPELVRRLDEALYRAKHNGRNRVEWISENWQPEGSNQTIAARRIFRAA